MNITNKRLSLLVSVLALILAAMAYGLLELNKQRVKFNEAKESLLGAKLTEERAREFEKNPNVDLCIFLIGGHHTLGKKDKALAYGKKCIEELASDKSEAGWYVRLYVAALNAEKGDSSAAEENLRVAIMLDKNNMIEQRNMILGFPELSAIYANILQKRGVRK